jgi:hypothetical protein
LDTRGILQALGAPEALWHKCLPEGLGDYKVLVLKANKDSAYQQGVIMLDSFRGGPCTPLAPGCVVIPGRHDAVVGPVAGMNQVLVVPCVEAVSGTLEALSKAKRFLHRVRALLPEYRRSIADAHRQLTSNRGTPMRATLTGRMLTSFREVKDYQGALRSVADMDRAVISGALGGELWELT